MATNCGAPRKESSNQDTGTRDSNKMVTSTGTVEQSRDCPG